MSEAVEPFSRQHYLRDLVSLAFPVMITDIAAVGRIFVGTYFVAQLGAVPLAMLAVAGSILSTSIAITLGLLAGTAQLAARHQKNPQEMERSFYNAIVIALVLGGVLTLVFWNFMAIASALHLPMHFGEAVSKPAVSGGTIAHGLDSFFKRYSLGVLPFCLAGALRFYLLGAQKTRVISSSNVFGFLICAVLTYLLVLGKFGLPRLGLNGFAWACVVSFWSVLIVLAVYVVRVRSRIHITRPTLEKLHWGTIRETLKLGVPISVMMGAEITFLTVIVFLMHDYGVAELAAYQVIMQLVVLSNLWSLSVSQGVVVLTSRSWHDKSTNVRSLYVKAQTLSFVSAIGFAALLVIFHNWIFHQFFSTEATFTAARDFLWAAVGLIVLESIRSNGFGVLRGLNYLVQPMLVLISSYGILGTVLLSAAHFLFDLSASSLLWTVAICNGVAAIAYQVLLAKTPAYRAARRWIAQYRARA